MIACVVAVAAVGAYHGDWLRALEAGTVDTRFTIRGEDRRPGNVVVVGVDDRTLADVGVRWPYPRSYHARVIDRLRRAGARVIAFDLQFTEPTRLREDEALIDAAGRAGNVVFGTTLVDRHGRVNVLGGDSVLRSIRAVPGNINFNAEPGGIVRHVPFSVDGLKTFAVVSAARFTGKPPSRAGFDEDGGAWIDYAGPPATIPTLPFSRVLRGRFEPEAVRGKLVVVGATAPLLQDQHPTAIAPGDVMSGPEMQANAIETVVRGAPLRDAPEWLGILLIAVSALLVPLLSALGSPRMAAAALLAGFVALPVGAQLAFNSGWVVPLLYPLGGLLLAGIGALGVNYVIGQRERRRMRELFADFMPEVVHRVLERQEGSQGLALAASEVVAGYRLERVIGQGGMGVVYLASQLSLDRQVALKLLAAQHWHDERYRKRFLRESRLAASIEHPNVVPVYEAGEDEGLLFIAMRYVEGPDLQTAVMLDGPLSPREALRLLGQIGSALDMAHARRLVHRDVKPANVLLTAGSIPTLTWLTLAWPKRSAGKRG